MKLEIARGLFLLVALGVATAAVAAWEEPRPQIFSKIDAGAQCPLPRVLKPQVDAKPDHDLLLLLFGLSQGVRASG
ncbi:MULTISPECIES: hypothetical protein [Pseudomonas]|uniref:Secreted protein n=2 Tax=Pseudomonas TaxID=286 RepID=A0A411MND1_9PSED|nr:MULTISPECIES: hypothetical protein [Pseudomonas]MDD1015308.1 hypothetical protein [Pseudomonas rubra]MDD1039530.1 hypothetical protein [Pseudomonas rubra]MDD1154044.1 hypothetical protein [Pseudomonas rubra]QBF28325.1 hypothetical protein EXN22_22490 [Pseudomonas tructae]